MANATGGPGFLTGPGANDYALGTPLDTNNCLNICYSDQRVQQILMRAGQYGILKGRMNSCNIFCQMVWNAHNCNVQPCFNHPVHPPFNLPNAG